MSGFETPSFEPSVLHGSEKRSNEENMEVERLKECFYNGECPTCGQPAAQEGFCAAHVGEKYPDNIPPYQLLKAQAYFERHPERRVGGDTTTETADISQDASEHDDTAKSA